ncbi:Glutathione gamma-glutamylcysteinyltransferase 3, partial [Schistosoma japonicum]
MNATQSFPEFYKSLKLGRIWSTFGVIKFSQIFGRLFLLNRQIYSFHNSVPLVKSNIILLSSTQSMSSSCNTTKFHTDVTSGVQQFYRRPLPRHCIPFSSPEGKRIFREALLSGHMETYFCLASQFCTQELILVVVWKSPWRWYHDKMLTCCLPQDVDLHRISSDTSLSHFRDIVMKMTSGSSKGYLVVCYSRSALGQTVPGHFAPVGGYHPERELVFLFDTARFKYPPHWVSLTKLWISMNQVDSDTQLPRGFVVLRKAAVPISTEQLVKAQKELRLSFSRETDNDYQDQSLSGSGLRLFSISDCAYQ